MRHSFLFIVILLAGCSGTRWTDENGLVAYVQDEDNGLRKSEETDGFRITATYRPSDFIARQQMLGTTMEEYDSLLKLYSKYSYFIVDISKQGKDLETAFVMERSDFASQISYLASRFSEKISVRIDDEVKPVSDFIYERSYGMTKSEFLVAFDGINESDFHLVIDGSELGFGEVSFPFEKNQIKSIPKLRI
ncbi:MAG: hypothetical protein WDO14_17235 [Bacteroidota bacterium]